MKKNSKANFKWKSFSKKQLKIMTWWNKNSPVKDYDGIIADGAVRSGKTIAMAPSFIMWAMDNFDECDFAICGKTIGSLNRNVINTLKKQLHSLKYRYEHKRSDNVLIVSKNGKTNYFYLFGGKDESSQDLIQGMTLAGIFFDEVVLMPESFVVQGLARLSVEGSKFWFNCNPDNPQHWFKIEFVDKIEEKHILYLHFTQDDNLTLSEKKKEQYRRMFKGVFYKRNILGLWVAAEGLIFQQISDNADRFITDEVQMNSIISIGIDWGGNGSAHSITATKIRRDFKGVQCIKSDKMPAKGTGTREVFRWIINFIKEIQDKFGSVSFIFADCAEKVLNNSLNGELRANGINLVVQDSIKTAIKDRIELINRILNLDKLTFIKNATKTIILALQTALYDEKAKDDRWIDDGKTSDIDSLDSFVYSFEFWFEQISYCIGEVA